MTFNYALGSDGHLYVKVAMGNWMLTFNTYGLHTGRSLLNNGQYCMFYYNGSSTLDLSHSVYTNFGTVEVAYISADFYFDKYRNRPSLTVIKSVGIGLVKPN